MSENLQTVRVNLSRPADDSYDIFIGVDLMEKAARDLAASPLGDRYVVVSDAKVLKLYGNKLTEIMRDFGLKVDRIGFPPGEESKSRKMKNFIEEHMLGMGLGRDSCVVACGGGVTGDLAGFTAATYMRGVPWVQYPTSLLAMVDASIGGKTGIDVPEGKNLIGAFHQPKAVYIDAACLETLPRRQITSGMAEVVKHAMIKDKKYFGLLENRAEAMLEGDEEAQVQIIARSCEIKAEVVSKDEKEAGLRKILNYGHTLGHAVEAVSGYSLLHGEAVSLGMSMEGALAESQGILDPKDLERQNVLLKNLGLPVKANVVLRALIGRQIRPKELLDYTHADKKARQGIVEYVLPAKIGTIKKAGAKSAKYTMGMDDKLVLNFLRKTFR